MTRSPLRLVLALCALPVAAMLLAGCGGSEAATPAIDDLAQVADRSARVDTASFVLHVDQTLGSETFSLSAEGAFDGKRDRARLTVDLSALAKVFAGLGKALGAPAGGLQDLDDPANWKLEALRDGSQLYVSSPLFVQALPDGKTWVSGDLEELGREHGVDLGQLGAFGKSDPRELLDVLRAASGGLDDVGTEAVRGVDTTHYRTTLDAGEVVALVGKNANESLVDSFTRAIEQSGLREIPIDVWVDDDSLLRRLDTTISVSPRGHASSSTLSLELYGYGEPLDLTPPPASRVASVDELRTHG